MIYTNYYESPLGSILLAGDEQGLTGLWFTEGARYIGLGLFRSVNKESKTISAKYSLQQKKMLLFFLFFPWISSIRSKGNGGEEIGFMASDISFMGLSSAAIRLELKAPHTLQRWMMAHSPFFLTHTAIGSITPPQSAALSPGSLSRCWLDRQYGQWFR